MKLVKMSEAEFKFWSVRSCASYAADKIRANGVTQEQADKIAADDFARMLPDGPNSKDSFLFTAKDEDRVVGYLWFVVRGPENDKRAFIADVIVEEEYRGKGYGRRVMLLLEQEVKAMGLHKIGLHVFGFNESAIKLYQSMGYLATDLMMEKALS